MDHQPWPCAGIWCRQHCPRRWAVTLKLGSAPSTGDHMTCSPARSHYSAVTRRVAEEDLLSGLPQCSSDSLRELESSSFPAGILRCSPPLQGRGAMSMVEEAGVS